MLLCEVACGKIFTAKENLVGAEKAPSGFDSVKAPGNYGPDYDMLAVMPNGVKIPYSKPI